MVGQLQAYGRGGSEGSFPLLGVECDSMVQRTEAGELDIKPKTSANDWVRWMENMQDWCVSRQLWWGHRCPAFLQVFEGTVPDVSGSLELNRLLITDCG